MPKTVGGGGEAGRISPTTLSIIFLMDDNMAVSCDLGRDLPDRVFFSKCDGQATTWLGTWRRWK